MLIVTKDRGQQKTGVSTQIFATCAAANKYNKQKMVNWRASEQSNRALPVFFCFISLTESLVRKRPTGGRLQIALEFNRLALIGECQICNQAPRLALISVR